MTPGAILSDASFPILKRHVLAATGLGYYADRDEDLATRFSRRITAAQSQNVAAYLGRIQSDSTEMECLISELTVGETYFFRQKEHFDLLRDQIIPDIVAKRAPSRSLRIWSAGCATGAEPYSISLLLGLEFPELVAECAVSILATDINVDFLHLAREGRFRDWYLRDTPVDIIARGFQREGKEWVIQPQFRRCVKFRYHNLATLTPPEIPAEPFDLIFCRNVLIYFSRDMTKDVCASFHASLAPNGWLVVGHAEPNLETFRQFDAVRTPAGTVYRRGNSSAPVFEPPPLRPVSPSAPPPLPPRQILPVQSSVQSQAIPTEEVKPMPVDDIRVLADGGNWETAFDQVDRLVKAEPWNAAAQFTMGLFFEHAGAPVEARAALRRAIYLDRGFALAHYHLGTSLQAAGETETAQRSFRTVLRLLESRGSDEPVFQGDGLTVKELTELTNLHMDLLNK